MKTTYNIGYIKTRADEHLQEVKDVLVDKGVVSNDTPYNQLTNDINKGFVEIEEKEQALDAVKQALIDKGVAGENTPYSELDDAINNIEIPETWENLDLESKKIIISKGYDYVYYHSNGVDAYGSYSSSSKQGIYHLNVLTREENKIYTSGNDWQYFFEDSKGNVYVGTNSSNTAYTTGILYLNGETVTQIYPSDGGWKYFKETNKGVIVTQTTDFSPSSAILLLDGQTVYTLKP